jgi:hypothetical protein
MEKNERGRQETGRREKEVTIRDRFKSSIKRGTGEAYLLIKKYPQIDFTKEILSVAANTHWFDAQSEGTREKYFYDLVNVSKNKTALIEKIIDLLKKERKDTWAIEQLFNLCAMFGKGGIVSARQAVYSQYMKNRIDDTPWLGEKAIINIDRDKGIEFLTELNKYDYKDRIKEYHSKSKKINFKSTYSLIKRKIDSDQLFLSPGMAKSINKTIIKKIANDFISEIELNAKLKYLKFFKWVIFPNKYQYLLDVLKKINSNAFLIEEAVESLKFFKGDDIRQVALKKVKSNRNANSYLGLLINNYQKDDAAWLYPLVKKQNTPDKAHSIIWDIVDIYRKNNTNECRRILEFLYENLACGPHRYDVVKILKYNGVLNKDIQKEIKYDSFIETRKLV